MCWCVAAQIYLNSSELFLLEERIHELEKEVLSLDENTACGTIGELEDKVALTVAMVSHRDDQVRASNVEFYCFFFCSVSNTDSLLKGRYGSPIR